MSDERFVHENHEAFNRAVRALRIPAFTPGVCKHHVETIAKYQYHTHTHKHTRILFQEIGLFSAKVQHKWRV